MNDFLKYFNLFTMVICSLGMGAAAIAQETATAKAFVSNDGSVTSVQVVRGGSAYYKVPLVTIKGGGYGASAIARLSGGAVSSITVVTGGTGYANPVSVVVAAPDDTLDQGLVGFYPFDGNAADLSGFGNPGRVHGRNRYIADRFGVPASALSFNGIGDYVESVKQLPDLASATVSFWAEFDSWFGYQSVFFEGDGSPGKDFACYFAGSPAFFVRSDNSTGVNNWMPPVGAWNHFVTVANASTRRLEFWVNGQLLTSNVFSQRTFGATKGYHSNLFFGARSVSADWLFQGALDDVRIYDHPLASEEVRALYSRELGKSTQVGISVASVSVRMQLTVGTTNQLQASADLIAWTPVGDPFVATPAAVSQILPTTNGIRFFRVVQFP